MFRIMKTVSDKRCHGISWTELNHRVIILLERACLHTKIGRNLCEFSRPECSTSHETARSLANGPSWGGGGGELWRGGGWRRSMCSAFPGNCSVSYLSFLSMRGVCGRSLTAGKILFTERQTCSLYLVLWLCGVNFNAIIGSKLLTINLRAMD